MTFRAFLVASLLIGSGGLARADAPPTKAPGVVFNETLRPVAVYDAAGNIVSSFGVGALTTSGAIQPPTAAAGKLTQTTVAVPASASTQLVAANANRIAIEIQCDGTAIVGLDRAGGTLTSAAAAPLVMPVAAYPIYNPPVTPLTAITGYTATAQTCRVTEYLR